MQTVYINIYVPHAQYINEYFIVVTKVHSSKVTGRVVGTANSYRQVSDVIIAESVTL